MICACESSFREVDVVLHPLKSELNFPYGPKEPLDGSSPRPFRWVGALKSISKSIYIPYYIYIILFSNIF